MLLASIKYKAEMESLVFLKQEAASYLPGITAFFCEGGLYELQINDDMLLLHYLVGGFAGFQERTPVTCLEMMKPFVVVV